MRDSDIPKNTTIASLWRNDSWVLPDPKDEAIEEAWDYVKNNFTVRRGYEDMMKWKVIYQNKFSIDRTRKMIREQNMNQSWFRVVWGYNSIPRNNFIMWLAIKRRLKTKNKLKKWGVIPDDICVMCNKEVETIDHCLYECDFAKAVWNRLKPICRIHQINS
ncbi:uncharacterized protein LOC126672769 [Mercurialis annua]|uniref:uncharacterized protein LOC126672764 n=1 Tax=Mercurialis annua TaxID=3986 RepID=UPI00215F4C44|nr:uncharacterized protein LOC126672764 [Mercurialis annua]XP_050222678.1 uncharacterized protein LOC126672769 [Mercurialis annua]